MELPAHCTDYLLCNPTLKTKTNRLRVGSPLDGKIHRTTTYLRLGTFNGFEEQFYYNKCICNEANAIINRHALGLIGPLDLKPLRTQMRTVARICAEHLHDKSSMRYDEVMQHTRTAIRGRYRRAYYDLKSKRVDLGSREARISSFVKWEKMPIDKLEAGKPPRLIQFRDYTYLYSLKAALLPYSIMIKTSDSLVVNGQHLKDVFTKTMNYPIMARTIVESWENFSDPQAFCLDHSKFDGHVAKELLALEKEYFTSILPSSLLKKLLTMQEKNKAITQNGLTYTTEGHRMSGEYNTSDGNSILNYCMLVAWLNHHDVREFRIHVNGDDSIVICQRGQIMTEAGSVDYFRRFNMETEIDRVVDDVRQISYCQMSPIRIRDQWTMIKTPFRAMSRMLYTDTKYKNCLDRYVFGSGLCELAVSRGVPIVQNFVLWLITQYSFNETRPLGSVDKTAALLSTNQSAYAEPDVQARYDFEAAFGITIAQQLAMESELAAAASDHPNHKTITDRLNKYAKFPQN